MPPGIGRAHRRRPRRGRLLRPRRARRRLRSGRPEQHADQRHADRHGLAPRRRRPRTATRHAATDHRDADDIRRPRRRPSPRPPGCDADQLAERRRRRGTATRTATATSHRDVDADAPRRPRPETSLTPTEHADHHAHRDTGPLCGATPRSGCRDAGRAGAASSRTRAATATKLTWKWLKGDVDRRSSAIRPPTRATRSASTTRASQVPALAFSIERCRRRHVRRRAVLERPRRQQQRGFRFVDVSRSAGRRQEDAAEGRQAGQGQAARQSRRRPPSPLPAAVSASAVLRPAGRRHRAARQRRRRLLGVGLPDRRGAAEFPAPVQGESIGERSTRNVERAAKPPA